MKNRNPNGIPDDQIPTEYDGHYEEFVERTKNMSPQEFEEFKKQVHKEYQQQN